MTIIEPMSHQEALKVCPDVNAYFWRCVVETLRGLPSEKDEVAFLHSELIKWERTERRLEKWAAKDDGSENPYSPPLDLSRVTKIIDILRHALRSAQPHEPPL
jgi:hypothetical protein